MEQKEQYLKEWNLRYLNYVAWGLIAIHGVFAVLTTYIILGDLTFDFKEKIFDNPSTLFAAGLSLIFFSIPLIFSIGILFRKNWSRLGIIVISILAISSTILYLVFIFIMYGQMFESTFGLVINKFVSNLVFLILYLFIFKYFRSDSIRKVFA